MIFIGIRFILSPEIAEAGYGIHFNEQGDYSFHFIKGIRDIFSGLLLCVFVLIKERRTFGITLISDPVIELMIELFNKTNLNFSTKQQFKMVQTFALQKVIKCLTQKQY